MRIDWGRLFTPSAWVQLGKVDWDYDAALSRALDEKGISHVEMFTAKIGVFEVWVGNFPYAYGRPRWEVSSPYTLPSMNTREKLRRMVNAYNYRGLK